VDKHRISERGISETRILVPGVLMSLTGTTRRGAEMLIVPKKERRGAVSDEERKTGTADGPKDEEWRGLNRTVKLLAGLPK
jgi:hypothetical protein